MGEIESLRNATDNASEEDKHIIAVGDWNVAAKRINGNTYQHKRICTVINEVNDTNSLVMAGLPETFFSRKHKYKSSLDHILFKRISK